MTTILCIEDEAAIREDTAEVLEDVGYDVLQASDGQEGLELIFKHEPDLVLCDITMPVKNGYDLMKVIRETYTLYAEMPFIFLTALADREQVMTGLKYGADAYLTKPIDFEMLLLTVQASLRQMERIQHKHEFSVFT